MQDPYSGRWKKKHSLKHTSMNSLQSCDRLSDLPDHLLLHILSFLKIEDVIKSSFLSRRWRSLWMHVPTIDFTWWSGEDQSLYRTVDRFLVYYEAMKIQKFHVECWYEDAYFVNVDSWINFIMGRDVEELYLDFIAGEGEWEFVGTVLSEYKLPSSFFHCASLRTLTLRHCDLNLPSYVCLTSLKTLCLWYLELTCDMFKILTSGCPLLEDLTLISCNMESDLNIFAANPHLKRLVIDEISCASDTNIKIYAPNLLMVEFIDRMWRQNYNCIKTLQSLVSANFDCDEMGRDLEWHDDNYYYAWAELIGDLHVKDLKLCSWFIQALSFIEVRHFTGPPISATHLELTTGFKKMELPGIAYLLKNSQNLETLTLNAMGMSQSFELERKEHDFDERSYWKVESIPLHHLKAVRVNFYRTWHTEEILDGNEVQFLKFILKNSRVLERMIIKFTRRCENIELEDDEVPISEVVKKLSSFPRASPNAEVQISEFSS